MNIVDKQIGAGDLLFLLTIALAFSPINFFLFYTSALVLTLVVTILVNLFRKQTRKEIPLAGALALPLIGLCFWKLIDPAKNFYNDEWIMNILYNT